jgi:diguanylate cyclase (GGDEF)-like protein/PAS domain S-box-containing protein
MDRFDVEQVHRKLLEEMVDGVYFVDRQRRILYWNRGAERITGFTADEVRGRCCSDGILMHVDDQGRCLCTDICPLAAAMDDGSDRQAHVFLHHRDGHRVPVNVRVSAVRDQYGTILGGVEVFSDDTPRLAYLDRIRQLEQEAFVDELTGLANRRLLTQSLNAQFSEHHRHEGQFGVILLDVDHFKKFNDTHGHAVGDRVLQMVGKTLSHNVRPYDTACRWGGEEFLILVGHAGLDPVRQSAERVRSLIEASRLTTNGRELSVTVSAGGTVVRDGDDAESIVHRADELLYCSKRDGRNRVTCQG